MMKKANRKVLIVIVALLLTLVTVSTATYAWFSMNTKASASNMELLSSAPTNMTISNDTEHWANGVITNTNISGGFSPSSSTDGKTFFALANTDGIEVEGSIIDDDPNGINNINDVELAQVNRVEDDNTYYVAFPLYIKAMEDNTKVNDLQLYLDSLTISSTEHNLQKVARVSFTVVTPFEGAVASKNTGVVTVNDNGTIQDSSSNLLTESSPIIYKYDSQEVDPISSVNGSGTPTLAGSDPAKMVDTDDDPTCFVVDRDGVYYTTIIVRIWLEGQHTSCINVTAGETISVSLVWKVKDEVQP